MMNNTNIDVLHTMITRNNNGEVAPQWRNFMVEWLDSGDRDFATYIKLYSFTMHSNLIEFESEDDFTLFLLKFTR